MCHALESSVRLSVGLVSGAVATCIRKFKDEWAKKGVVTQGACSAAFDGKKWEEVWA